MNDSEWKLKKRPTGIVGLDRLTYGGLPTRQATLIAGGTGSGKSVLALQILANAAAEGSGGVFVTLEESPAQIRRNADSFSWGRALNESRCISTIDARITPGSEWSGDFDIDALLAAVEHKAAPLQNPWIVIDGIDQLLQHQADRRVAVDQVRQINEHCEEHGWTLLLTGKLGSGLLSPQHLEGAEYMLPTMLLLSTEVLDRRLHRLFRVAKYRGSDHVRDELPMIIDQDGIQLPFQPLVGEQHASGDTERISTGIEQLDKVLGGGIYRGSSVLISGRPGTSKSTLSACIAECAAQRGERALYVSFDEQVAPFVRNLSSVNVDLKPHIDEGIIKFNSRAASSALVSEHVLAIQQLIEEFDPQFLLIDPVSALLKSAGSGRSRDSVERILEVARARNITTILTSLTNEDDPEGEATIAHVSTIADTWIVLDYNVRGGERNRSISIVKSRGSGHSNQQRELLLSSNGIELASVYDYGTEVLMGTARAQKESEELSAARREAVERNRRREDLERRIEKSRSDLEHLTEELKLQEREIEESDRILRRYTKQIKQRRESGRGADNGGDK